MGLVWCLCTLTRQHCGHTTIKLLFLERERKQRQTRRGKHHVVVRIQTGNNNYSSENVMQLW